MKTVRTLLVMLLCATASSASFGQTSSEHAYKRALEDSLIRYEFLKPAYVQLRSDFATTYRQNVSLRIELQGEKLHHKATQDQLRKAIARTPERWWNGFYWGGLVGVATTIIILR